MTSRSSPSPAAFLDAQVERHRTPGVQYVVVNAAETVFEHAAGFARIADGVRMESSTSLMSYSMSKTITAVAVLQLVEDGRVRLDDPVNQYVDDNPYGGGITIRQLIAHTSGIPNPIPLRWVHLVQNDASFDEDAVRSAQLRRHPRLAFAPGTKYRYSNIGYWMLGAIVERASGAPFTSYVGEHVFRRLGTSPTELGYRVADRDRHARGYLERYSVLNLAKGLVIDRALIGAYEGRWLHIVPHYTNGPAFGGIVGTARGFAAFLQDQLRPQSVLLGEPARELLYEQQHTSDGRPVEMTLGWHVGELGGTRCYYKEGGGGGFHAMMRLYPGFGIGTVVMTNATSFDVAKCLDTLDPGFLG